ncbi:MAG: DUF4157 domain-containing protein [Deltaproteobacteria bacterium]|nr:DUF4157 domain-containing protein [Deltaproteobacteria bacterium]MBW2254340.1 DUF4157 domain-containing protein [Deltaproteobacteria bacterium]
MPGQLHKNPSRAAGGSPEQAGPGPARPSSTNASSEAADWGNASAEEALGEHSEGEGPILGETLDAASEQGEAAASGSRGSGAAGGAAGDPANPLSVGGMKLGGTREEIAEYGVSGTPGRLPYLSALEAAFGTSFGGVRVYTDERAQAATRELGAEGYTYGSSIALSEPNPAIEIVAHELAHAIQQGAAGQATGAGGDLEGEAEAAADQVGGRQPVTVPFSPTGGPQLQELGFSIDVGSVVSAVTDTVGDVVDSVQDLTQNLLDSLELVTLENIGLVLDKLNLGDLLGVIANWSVDDLADFIIQYWDSSVVPMLVRTAPIDTLAEVMQRLWEGTTSAAQDGMDAAATAALSVKHFVEMLVRADIYVQVFEALASIDVGQTLQTAREWLADELLANVLNAARELANMLFEMLWPANMGARAKVTAKLGVEVGPIYCIIVAGGGDGAMLVSIQHVPGPGGPGIKVAAKQETGWEGGLGVGHPMANAKGIGGMDDCYALGGTLWTEDLDNEFWDEGLLGALRDGDFQDVLTSILFGAGDVTAAIQWSASQTSTLALGGEAELGSSDIGAWIKLLATQGFNVGLVSPTDSNEGRLTGKARIGRSFSFGASLSIMGDDEGNSAGESMNALVAMLMNLQASAELDEELGIELGFGIPTYEDLGQGELPTLAYLDVYQEVGGKATVCTETIGARVGQALRFTPESIQDTWEDFDVDDIEPREIIERMPFASIRFMASAFFESSVIGVLIGLIADPTALSVAAGSPTVSGSVKLQLNITKELILDLLEDLWEGAGDVVEAIKAFDGPALVQALMDILGDIGDFLYDSIEYVDLMLDASDGVGGDQDVGYVTAGASAEAGLFFQHKYMGGDELSEVFDDVADLSDFVGEVLLLGG